MCGNFSLVVVGRGVWGSGERAGDQVFRHQRPEGVEAEEWLRSLSEGVAEVTH